MTMTRSLYTLSGLLCGALLVLSGCGDDGDGEGTDTEGSTGSSSSSGTDVTTAPETMTADDGTSTTDPGTSTTDPGTTTTEPGTTTSDTSGDSGSSTGAPADCGDAADPMACEMAMGCVWVGNPQNGSCLPDDPMACDGLEMQPCQQHPQCDWNNQDGMCSPA